MRTTIARPARGLDTLESRSDFHKAFLRKERRAILHRWVADQVATPRGSGRAPDTLPLVGYASEFLERFLEDVNDGGTDRSKAWIRQMVDEAVLTEVTPLSLASFLISLKNAIGTLWSMEAWSRYNGLNGESTLPAMDLVGVVDTHATLDAVLLSGLEDMERRRATDPSVEIDSLELLEARRREHDSIDCLDSVEIAPPASAIPAAGMRNVAGQLKNFVNETPAEQRLVALTLRRADRTPKPRLFDRANEDFLAKISHEFRSPLSSILSVCQMCLGGKEALLTGDGGSDAFDIIERSARQLLHLTENLMEAQRLEANTDTGVISLRDLVEDLVAVFTPPASRKGLTLKIDVPPQLPDLRTDLQSLTAILRNLLANAINYTGEGHVELWAMADPDDASGRTLVLGVSDSGPGIPTEQVPHIFEPFWRGSNGRSSEHRGTGLGLAIVKEAVLRIGGEIAVQSEEGAGTTFVIALSGAFVEPAAISA